MVKSKRRIGTATNVKYNKVDVKKQFEKEIALLPVLALHISFYAKHNSGRHASVQTLQNTFSF